jgi:hypothetical protein
MSEDKTLDVVNKKTWDKTRPIMICNVLSFVLLMSSIINRAAGLSNTWLIIFLISSVVLTILSVHYAWDLETKL